MKFFLSVVTNTDKIEALIFTFFVSFIHYIHCREREKSLNYCLSLQIPRWMGLYHAKCRSHELNEGLPCGMQGLRSTSSQGHINRQELSWDSNSSTPIGDVSIISTMLSTRQYSCNKGLIVRNLHWHTWFLQF